MWPGVRPMRVPRRPPGWSAAATRASSPPGSTRIAAPLSVSPRRSVFSANGPTTVLRTMSMASGAAGSARPPSTARSGAEALPAAAGVAGVGGVELEPRALQADDVVDRHPLHVHPAHRVDEQLHPVLLEGHVSVLLGVLEVHRVLKHQT